MTADTAAYVIGLDFGTDSVRAVLVDARHGIEISSSVFLFPRWRDGLYCNAADNQFRQHPLDHIEGIEYSINECLALAKPEIASKVIAISIDTTGSSPLPVNRSGTALALLPGFENNPNAMVVLWKDHTAIGETVEINQAAMKFPVNYLKYVGGIYSSEWFWAKWLHILRADVSVRDACYSWVEHCDWIPYLLTGGDNIQDMKRGICAAGHKALWSADWGGLPPDDFINSLDPLLKGATRRLYNKVYTADKA